MRLNLTLVRTFIGKVNSTCTITLAAVYKNTTVICIIQACYNCGLNSNLLQFQSQLYSYWVTQNTPDTNFICRNALHNTQSRRFIHFYTCFFNGDGRGSSSRGRTRHTSRFSAIPGSSAGSTLTGLSKVPEIITPPPGI